MSELALHRVLIVGRGRLGSSLARALRSGGSLVALWAGRGRWPSRAPHVDVVLLAVADPFLEATAERLAPRLSATVPVLHASGARGPDAISKLAPRPLGVLHPLVSFASGRAPSLDGAAAVIDGSRLARDAARILARRVGLVTVEAAIHGPRYHAAAALVANGAAALATLAVDALEAEGIPRARAARAVAGLLRSVAENVGSVGVPAALTGPIVRGDASTVAAHRSALQGRARAAYDALAPVILDVAIDSGLSAADARAIRASLRARHQRKR